MLKLIPTCLGRQGHEFESLAHQHHSSRRLRKMTRWTQFVAMATAQLSGRHSLRDVVSNLTAQARKLYHLGIHSVSRSSLSRVNESQPYELYATLFAKLLARCQSRAPSSSMLDWITRVCCRPACSRQAFVAITEGKTHDLSAARALQLPRGSIVVMDRGYNDYAWYNQLNNKDISFVIRLKTNAQYRVIAAAGSATVSAERCSKPKA